MHGIGGSSGGPRGVALGAQVEGRGIGNMRWRGVALGLKRRGVALGTRGGGGVALGTRGGGAWH